MIFWEKWFFEYEIVSNDRKTTKNLGQIKKPKNFEFFQKLNFLRKFGRLKNSAKLKEFKKM
jgi:hypothetical protein